MRADRVVNKSILAIAPCTEHHAIFGIGIDDAMRPTWRNDNLIAGIRGYGKATAGIIVGALLRVDNRATLPNLEQLRSRPSAVRCYGMDMAAVDVLLPAIADGTDV